MNNPTNGSRKTPVAIPAEQVARTADRQVNGEKPAAATTTASIQKKFQAVREELAQALLEKEPAIDLILTALLAREHVLLVGPPGTGKSKLARAVCSWVEGRYFEKMFSPTTTPDEVFGPISIRGLKEQDVVIRNTKGAMPDAHIVFADEVWKGNSATLNTMLSIMNERLYHNGTSVTRCPLQTMIGASNEWAGAGDEGEFGRLSALWDRFLFRMKVDYVQRPENLERLMWDSDEELEPKFSAKLSMDELSQAQTEARRLPVSDEAKDAMRRIFNALAEKSISVSDRRRRQSTTRAIQAYAYLCGASEVLPEHLEILSHCLWTAPTEEQQNQVKAIVLPIANPLADQLNTMYGVINEAMKKVAWGNLKNTLQVSDAMDVIKQVVAELQRMRKKTPHSRISQALRYAEQQHNKLNRELQCSFDVSDPA